MRTIDDVSATSVDISDIGADAKLVFQILLVDLEELRMFPKKLRASLYLRELAPLLIEDLTFALLNGAIDRDLSVPVMRLLPAICRPGEVHSLSLDVWIKLWSEHRCEGDCVDDCAFSFAASLIALMTVDVIAKTVKGSLFKKREDYMLSFAGQILSKYWLKKSMHAKTYFWSDVGQTLVESFSSWNNKENDHLNLARAEICIRIVSASGIDVNVFKNDSFFLNFVTTRIQTISNQFGERSGDFEILDSDLALMLAREDAESCPQLLPRIWSEKKREQIQEISLSILLRDEQFIAVNFFMILATNTFPYSIYQRVIEIATSIGSESDLSIQNRQAIYQKVYSKFMVSKELTQCKEIAQHSQVDSCVGIFVKIAKDIAGADEVCLLEFAKIVFPLVRKSCLIDSLDSLKSLLNWMRLCKGIGANEYVRNELEHICSQIENELAKTKGIENTRILMIHHLVSLVIDK